MTIANHPDTTPASGGLPSTADRDEHVTGMSVRELLVELTDTEDALRDAPALSVVQGRTVVNPLRRRIVAQQRSIVAELRSRRALLRGHQRHEPLRQAPAPVAVSR